MKLNDESSYEETITGFATKLHEIISADDYQLIDFITNDKHYIKQMTKMISTIYHKTYEQVDVDISNQLDMLDKRVLNIS